MRGLAAFLLGLLALPALAQVPTAEQLEMLRNLTPEQRQMLLEQLGVGAEPSSGSKEKKQADATSEPFPRKSTSLSEVELAEQLRRAQALRGDDTVIVSVEFPETRVEPSMQEGH